MLMGNYFEHFKMMTVDLKEPLCLNTGSRSRRCSCRKRGEVTGGEKISEARPYHLAISKFKSKLAFFLSFNKSLHPPTLCSVLLPLPLRLKMP